MRRQYTLQMQDGRADVCSPSSWSSFNFLPRSLAGSTPWAACLPLFGRLRRDAGVEHLAGEAPVPPILRPVEMTLAADCAHDFAGVAACLRRAVHLCTLLDNQQHLARLSTRQHPENH